MTGKKNRKPKKLEEDESIVIKTPLGDIEIESFGESIVSVNWSQPLYGLSVVKTSHGFDIRESCCPKCGKGLERVYYHSSDAGFKCNSCQADYKWSDGEIRYEP